jgi:hypothetical protein
MVAVTMSPPCAGRLSVAVAGGMERTLIRDFLLDDHEVVGQAAGPVIGRPVCIRRP